MLGQNQYHLLNQMTRKFRVMAINWLWLSVPVLGVEECMNSHWTITDMKSFVSDEIMCENKQIAD